jgi:hypothetical protein
MLLVLCLVASCTEMKSRYPAGEPVPLFEEYKDEVSIWRHGDSVFFVKPLDDYRAAVASLKWDESSATFKLVRVEASVGQLGDHMFLSHRELGSETPEQYSIYRLEGAGEAVLIFQPNSEKLSHDIRQGRIKATKPDNHTYEMKMTKQELDVYVSENADSLFKFEGVSILSPIVAMKRDDDEAEKE